MTTLKTKDFWAVKSRKRGFPDESLDAKGIAYGRLNTEDFPFSCSLSFRPEASANKHWLVAENETLPVPTAIWYRRVRSAPKPDGMDEGVYAFCVQETRAAVLGSIMGLRSRWMSHPAAVWQAEFKPFQLSLAAGFGLEIPKTVVTNEPQVILESYAEFGRMIVKATRSGHLTRAGEEFAMFTSEVLERHLEEVNRAKLSPAIYQALIPKRHDIRVTIVGQQVFAVAIESQSDPSAMIDWRQTQNSQLPHHRITLPADIASKLLLLMDSMRLAFGAVDMIETPDGEYVFLEINPNGQWLWLDDMLDCGISDAVATWLSKTDLI